MAVSRPTPKKVAKAGGTLMERLEAVEAEHAPANSKRPRERSIEIKINKALRDHFEGWPASQTDTLLNSAGKSLREVLRHDFEQVQSKKEVAVVVWYAVDHTMEAVLVSSNK